jgi:predicted NAD/FAD-binding protein
MRFAIVGAGIAGLGSAYLLQRAGHQVTLFEAEQWLGGHAHTVDVTLEGITHPVDTGFLVYNDRTYPRLTALFDELRVPTVASTMSFAVRHDGAGIEWAGTSLASLFAHPPTACRPRYWRMLADILRFNRATTALHARAAVPLMPLGAYLDAERYGAAFRDWYLLPMTAAIWSSPRRDVLDFPLPAFVRFCHNHGLLQVFYRPQWRTVAGGSRNYVDRIVAALPDIRRGQAVRRITRDALGVLIDSPAHAHERFAAVVVACHSNQALALLGDASHTERSLLGAVRYQDNRVVLHTDPKLLPRSRRAWSAWNYLASDDPDGDRGVAVSYLLNQLQPLPWQQPVIVTLNPPFEPDRTSVIDEFSYAHPLLDGRALAAQADFGKSQGSRSTWFAGAWLGHGFHEDGLASAHAVAESVALACTAEGFQRARAAA